MQVPISLRLQNAVVSTAGYLRKMIWPIDLAAFYPYPSHIDLATVILSGMLLTAMTLGAVCQSHRRPHVLFGWLWYLIFLLPSIGIIQAGRQSMGDRFTYWPMIGIVVALVGEAELWLRGRPALRPRAKWISVTVMSALALLSWNQALYWRDSVALFEHSLSAGGDNEYIRGLLGTTLMEAGRFGEAEPQLEAAVRMAPARPNHRTNLAWVELRLSKVAEARRQAVLARDLAPSAPQPWEVLAKTSLRVGSYQEGVEELRAAVAKGGDAYSFASQLNDMGAGLAQRWQFGDGETLLRAAVEFRPDLVEAHKNLSLLLMNSGRTEEAREQVRVALARVGSSPVLSELAAHLRDAR